MPTTSVNITDQMNEWINHKVLSGDYNNASEVFREALRVLKAQEERNQLELDFIRHKLSVGIDQANKHEYSSRNIEQIISDTKSNLHD